MASGGPPAGWRNSWLAAMAGLTGILLTACASFPTSGDVQAITAQQGAGGGLQRNLPQSIPVPPGSNWRPDQVVSGFLAASASFAGDYAVARQYLAPQYRNTWHPVGPTVVSPQPVVKLVPPISSHLVGSQASANVTLTGRPLATVTAYGQYLLSSGGQQTYGFGLIHTSEGWRIDRMQQANLLLLTEPDFLNDYEATNLYFYAASPGSPVLVPDPVFERRQQPIAERANGLVTALLHNPVGWLSGAAASAFPPRTHASVTISGSHAIVRLSGAAARAGTEALQRMAGQLVLTLTSSAYSALGISSVALKVNQHDWPHQGAALQPGSYAWRVPSVPAGPAYFQGPGGVRRLSGTGQSLAMALPSAVATTRFTAIAVSPGSLPMFAGCRGKTVYISQFRRTYRPLRQVLPSACTSLSWDTQGNLWAAGGTVAWLIPPGAGKVIPVVNPTLPGSDVITDLRVAPDGTRAAMIIRDGKGMTQVIVAAISRTPLIELARSDKTVAAGSDIAHPAALCWLDPDHLLVLGQSGTSAQLYEVPLNGGASAPIGTVPATVAVAATSTLLFTGTAGQIWISPGTRATPRLVATGSDPVLPG